MSDSSTKTNYPDLARYALAVGFLGLAIALYGLVDGVSNGNQRPLFSWLIGISFWLNIGVGFLFITMIFYIFDAGWGVIIRRQYEHAIGGFKWLFIIFLPLIFIAHGVGGDFDVGLLWKWVNPNAYAGNNLTVAEDPLYLNKEPYLNLNAFTIRFCIYFAVWIGISWYLRRCSYLQDKDGDVKHTLNARKFSCVGLIMLALAGTFAAFDWYMSIEYHWFSTMYGVWFFAESMRSGFAFTVIIIYLLSTRGYLKGLITQAHFYLTGCAMLAFTLVWA